MLRHLPLLLGLVLLSACQQTTRTDQEQATDPIPADTVAQDQPPASSLSTTELPAAASRAVAIAFGKPAALNLPTLEKLCQNKYGCLQEKIFPLGWSADGKFAYLLERTNEAVNNYTLDAYVLDATSNILVDSLRFRASDRPDYTEETGQFDFDRVWELQEKAIRKLVEVHSVTSFSGTALQPLSALELTIQAKDESVTSMYTGKKVLSSHELKLQTGETSRTLHTQTYGKYDLVLATELLGAFQSPDGNYHALLEAEEKRGYEGPPNVLKLRVIGL